MQGGLVGKIVWLASYPKSGNTWLRAFLSALRHGREVDPNRLGLPGCHAASRALFDEMLSIESAGLGRGHLLDLRPRVYEVWAREAREPLLFSKTHDAFRLTGRGEPLFPPAATHGVIHLVRNPLDVVASFAHHSGWSLEETVGHMADEDFALSHDPKKGFDQLPQLLSSWSGHTESWLGAPLPRITLRYEDLLGDPLAAFGRALAFLGLPHGPGAVAEAVARCGFAHLQAAEAERGFGEKPRKMGAFFRRGRQGGWRQELPEPLVRGVLAAHGRVMDALGYGQ